MLRISYDIKPIPSNIRRMRLNVIDSFINQEIIELEKHVLKLLLSGKSKLFIKNIYDKQKKILDDEIEKKRLFMIKLKGILSCRRQEYIDFIIELNLCNK